MIFIKKLVTGIFILCAMVFSFYADNAHAAILADGAVNDMVVQPDGKIVIGGQFSAYNFIGRNRIARINADGSLDQSFDPGAGVDDGYYIGVEAVALQGDGKIIIVGDFSAYDGISRNSIARINADGSLDTYFDPGIGPNDTIRAVAIQSDGKIIIAGDFTTYAGSTSNHIARLLWDGSIDTSYVTGSAFPALANVYDMAFRYDGKIIAVGEFSSYNGTARNNIVCINTDGSLDTSFNPGTGFDQQVQTITVQSDNKIIVGGGFTAFNGTSRNRIARINTDGSLDTSFNPGTGANSYVNAVDVQLDGKILIGGNFTVYNGVGTTIRIARLNSDGTRDVGFSTGMGANNWVRDIKVQSDGNILLGGSFTTFNTTSVGYMTQINSAGSVVTDFGLPDMPTVSTDPVTDITSTTAMGHGVVIDTGGEAVERLLEWGTSSGDYVGSCSAGNGVEGEYSCNMYDLMPETLYYVRASVVNSAGYGYGDEITFTTGASPLITMDAMNITSGSATANAMLDITCDGEDDPAECSIIFDRYIEWGTLSGQYWEGSCYADSGNAGVFSCEMENLEPNTTYYVRAVMQSYGEVPVEYYGNEISFQTTQGLTVETNAAINITSTSATLGGNILDTGGEETIGRWIEIGTSSGEYYLTGCDAGFGGEGAFTCDIGELTPGTTYYYRAVASGEGSGGGGEIGFFEKMLFESAYAHYKVYGSEMTFTTTNGEGEEESGANEIGANLSLSVSENLTLDCGSSIDLDNGAILIAGTPQTSITTCHVTTNDQDGYTLSLTNDRGSDNVLYHTINSTTQDGQIQDKTPWSSAMPNAQEWADTGLGFGILSSTATKNESWWGTADDCGDAAQRYAGIPQSDTSIMQHENYSNAQTDTTICYKLDIPSTQISGEYTGSVTYTAAGRP